jgi:hypothetical protein
LKWLAAGPKPVRLVFVYVMPSSRGFLSTPVFQWNIKAYVGCKADRHRNCRLTAGDSVIKPVFKAKLMSVL